MDVAREMIGDSETPATVLHVILLKKYGEEAIYGSDEQDAIDPVVLWGAVEEDFRISVPVEVENKLNAMMTACSTPYFFHDKQVFASICVALQTGDLGDAVNGEFEQPSTYEMLCSIQEVDLNDGDREVLFSPDIRNLIAWILDNENVDTSEEYADYEEDVNAYLTKIVQMLQAIGAPPNLVDIPKDSDFYGLLKGGN